MEAGELRLLGKASGISLLIVAMTVVIVRMIEVVGDLAKLLLQHAVLVAVINLLVVLTLIIVSRR